MASLLMGSGLFSRHPFRFLSVYLLHDSKESVLRSLKAFGTWFEIFSFESHFLVERNFFRIFSDPIRSNNTDFLFKNMAFKALVTAGNILAYLLYCFLPFPIPSGSLFSLLPIASCVPVLDDNCQLCRVRVAFPPITRRPALCAAPSAPQVPGSIRP